jgi:hypothetical protein
MEKCNDISSADANKDSEIVLVFECNNAVLKKLSSFVLTDK